MPTDDPRERVPNLWFDLNPDYAGPATISFDGGKHIVEGNATYSHSPIAGSTIEFECRDADQSRDFDRLYWREQPGVIHPEGPRRPDSITIRLDSGTFVASYKVFFRSHSTTIGGPGSNSKATFGMIGAMFTAGTPRKPAAHAVLPLYNMLSPAFDTWPKPQPETINNHCLRIFPTPPELAEGASLEDQLERNWNNRLISFLIDGKIGFIEPLPDYKERAKQLREGTIVRLVTAILVFDDVARDCRIDEPPSWFPIDLLNLLSLATGYRVGAPWIEYRDEDGRLVRRSHVAFGSPNFKPGHPLMLEILEPKTGYFITQGMQSAELATKPMRLMITHLINAGMRQSSIEDRFLSISRAFEAFATHRGLSVQDIKAGLDAATSQKVTTLLDTCWQDLRALSNSLADAVQKKAVSRVADKARSADQKDKNFGDAVADIAVHMGFEDKTALLTGFVASNGNNWCAFLSFLRGAAVHEGGFDTFGGIHDVLEIVRVTDHLHDLLVRIMCKLLGSKAKYSSPIFPIPMLRELDWVTSSTPASQMIVSR